MGLKIIGSGFGRTGTMSTKMALEQLGFGPCHHMVEVMGNPAQPAHWKARAAGQEMDWAEVFEGYQAQVDFPGASVWHELSIAFPEAKVIHTERPRGGVVGQLFRHDRQVLRTPQEPAPAAAGRRRVRDNGQASRRRPVRRSRPATLDRRLPAQQRDGAREDPGREAAGVHALLWLGTSVRLPRSSRSRVRVPAQQRARGILGLVRRRTRRGLTTSRRERPRLAVRSSDVSGGFVRTADL